MKKLKCKHCDQVWYVDRNNLDNVQSCPYCSQVLREKVSLRSADTLDKAIYIAVSAFIEEGFPAPGRISGYISDIAPNLKKELRVLSHSFHDDYFSLVKQAFEKKPSEAEPILAKLVHLLIDDEGLSETWAKQIGSSYLGAIKLMHGVGAKSILSGAVISDFEVKESVEPKNITDLTPEELKELQIAAMWADYEKENRSVSTSPDKPISAQSSNYPPEFNVSGNTLIGYTGNATKISIPEGIVDIAPCAFYGNDTISEVRFPRSLRLIGEDAFSHCSKLTVLHFADGLREIGAGAFTHCTKIRELYLPKSLYKIGQECFYQCRLLQVLSLPDGLIDIPERAFFECDLLSTVVAPSKLLAMGKNAFSKSVRLVPRKQ